MDTLTAPSDTRFRADTAAFGALAAPATLPRPDAHTPLRARKLSRGTR